MKKIVAKTLQDALLKASEDLRCSVVDLEYEIVQNPSTGILGIGRKEAIIIVDEKTSKPSNTQETRNTKSVIQDTNNMGERDLKTPVQPSQAPSAREGLQNKNFDEVIWGVEPKTRETQSSKSVRAVRDSQEQDLRRVDAQDSQKSDSYEGVDSFGFADPWDFAPQGAHSSDSIESSTIDAPISYDELLPKKTRTKQPYSKEAFDEIEREIVELFSYLPFEIDSIKVELYKENVVAVTINGPDCALLIGEKGYRCKAISYLLFNWINPKYGYGVRLEIAEFLRNQERIIDIYLDGIIKIVRAKGSAQTKVLDGVLAYIALGKLRVIFPYKYVSFRTNEEGQRYIVVSDFKPS